MLTKLEFKLRSLLDRHRIVLGDAVVRNELAADIKGIFVVLRMPSFVTPSVRIARISAVPINMLTDGSLTNVINCLIRHQVSELVRHLAREGMMPGSSVELANRRAA